MPRSLTALLLGALLAFAPSAQADDRRVALVIGNSAYEQVAALRNATNDADSIAAVLTRLGFEVVKGTNLTHDKFAQIVRDFSRALPGADTAVLFYAGHGLRVNDRNYLSPIDTKLESEADLDFELVQVETILTQMEREPRVNIVLLDACRDNPLARNLARSMGTRSAAIGRGLARIESGIGTLIAFATQPGNVALDGDGNHSPFTAALLKHIETPGLDVAMLMRQVRQDVIASTSSKQVPWDHSSLTSGFTFNPAGAAAQSLPVAAPQQLPKPAAPAAPKVAALPSAPVPNEKAQTEWPRWVKLCQKNAQASNKQICLVHQERLDPDTGALLGAAALRLAEGDENPSLLVRVATTNSLSVPPGLQIKIDDDESLPLQYAVCFPNTCQVQMEVTADLLGKIRKGRRMLVTMITSEQETTVLPVLLEGFDKAYDGLPMNQAQYETMRRKMMERFTQRQKTASLEPEPLFPGAEGKAFAAQIAAIRASREAGTAAQPKAAALGNDAWVKLCMNNEQSSTQKIC